MAPHRESWTDEQVEQVVGRLLQVGVSAAALVVLAGGFLYLVRHGTEAAEHHVFYGEPAELRSLGGIATAAVHLRGRGLIQLGLLLLIATPVARVAFSVVAFLRERDYTYVVVTLIVLAILLYSLFAGHL